MTPVEEAKESGGGTTNADPEKPPANKYMMGLVDLLGVDDEENDPHDDERHDAAGFTKDYLQRTSLHGLQYIGENNRSLFERIFWVFSFCLGGFLASYFISALWDKWETSPVYVSVETTSHPIYDIPFPAVSICSVNKVEEDRLLESIEKIREETDYFDDTTLDIRFMLDAMIRYDEINASDPTFHDTSAAMFPPSELIKLFKSSMPPCKNMLMYCKWQNMETDCLRLFKVITTDDGFCCVFNALDSEDILKEDSAKVPDDFAFIEDTHYTKFVCKEDATDCTEGWIGGDFEDWIDDESEWWQPPSPSPPPPPGPPSGRRKRRKKRSITMDEDKVERLEPLPVPQVTRGAGKFMGLSVMLFANKGKYFLPSAFFEGFKVLVHHPSEFPYVKDKGFVVAPGTEMFVAVDAYDVYSTEAVRELDLDQRYCYFYDERGLDYYQNYSRSNCLMECSTKLINHLCGCQPYFYPVHGEDLEVCGLDSVPCLAQFADYLRQLAFPTEELQEKLEEAGLECNCPGGCDELSYRQEVSLAPFPSDLAFNSEDVRKAFARSDKDIDFFREETTYLHVYFKNEFLLQYKRDTLYGVNDFISNMGGLMGLCLGFSLLSFIEVIYWFCVRWGILLLKRKKQAEGKNQLSEADRKDNIDANIKQTTGKVFDEIFKAPNSKKGNNGKAAEAGTGKKTNPKVAVA